MAPAEIVRVRDGLRRYYNSFVVIQSGTPYPIILFSGDCICTRGFKPVKVHECRHVGNRFGNNGGGEISWLVPGSRGKRAGVNVAFWKDVLLRRRRWLRERSVHKRFTERGLGEPAEDSG